MAEIEYEYLKCGTPPNEHYAFNIKSVELFNCGSPLPSEADVMKKVKEYLLMVSYHITTNGTDLYPDDFEVSIKSPACMRFEVVGSSATATVDEVFAQGLNECEDCCSNTYTLDQVDLYTVSVTDVNRDVNNITACSQFNPSGCQYVCDSSEIDEGPINVGTQYLCLSGTNESIFFGDQISHSSGTRKYTSTIDYNTGSNPYKVSPKLIFDTDGNGGVDDYESMWKYLMDIMNNRVSLFGVSAGTSMELSINNCWQYDRGTTHPCGSSCCVYRIDFDILNQMTVTELSSGSSCTSPCFDACSAVMELDGRTVANAKPIFDDNVNQIKNGILSINPNPSSGVVNIEFDSEFEGNIFLNIVTLDGHTIATRYLDKTSKLLKYQFNFEDFSSGTYYIQITAEGKKIASKKLIIKN